MTFYEALRVFIEDKLYISFFKFVAGATAFYIAVYTLCAILY